MRDPLLKFGFYSYMNDLTTFSSDLQTTNIESLPALIYTLQLQKELKIANGLLSQDKTDHYLLLLKTYLYKRSLREGLAALKLLTEQEDLTPATSRLFTHINRLSAMTPNHKPSALSDFPRLIVFLLQNLNRLSLHQLQIKALPVSPFTSDMKVSSFLLDSFALTCAAHKFEAEINMNAVLNAPNIEIALTQMVKFTVLEE